MPKEKAVLDDESSGDSENDSDYDPTKDADKQSDDDDGQDAPQLEFMTASRKRKVNDLWESMLEEDNASVVRVMNKSMTKALKKGSGETAATSSRKEKKRVDKTLNVLSSIFGLKEAKKLVSKTSVPVPSDDIGDSAPDIKVIIQESVRKVQKKAKVVEVRKFAGREISIETTKLTEAYPIEKAATKSSSSSSSSNSSRPLVQSKAQMATMKTLKASSSAAASTSGLDTVLDTLKGPKLISTVTKSSIDWENYKEKEGLDDDLAGASKDGYLTRQDFLTRCDFRQYEQERDARLAKVTPSV